MTGIEIQENPYLIKSSAFIYSNLLHHMAILDDSPCRASKNLMANRMISTWNSWVQFWSTYKIANVLENPKALAFLVWK